ncbi:DNA-directed RNA polymerase III subunit RPC3-like isoform X2 [Centruroides sculpturatus]|uniref:DNA-directed RNA polymerase III subunit RPC3-like isoform X2 n=1 Tax=Centruroides sculpturatus TaxID=218467 RepID=UPI000C6E214E|nr:DNA-directed RNA polymerase III subunit RPC3-like isoform X2 [Centruroides sculpturatus]
MQKNTHIKCYRKILLLFKKYHVLLIMHLHEHFICFMLIWFRFFFIYFQLCRSLLDRCYKVMFNSICHREFINREHKRLLEKKQRVEAITATLQQSGADSTQIQEVEDMISPPEHAQLERVKQNTNKLEHSEIQLDETIFTLSMWLKAIGEK